MASEPKFAVAVSTSSEPAYAVRQTLDEICQQLDEIQLAVVFGAAAHFAFLENQPRLLAEALGTEQLIGCTSDSIIANNRELEQEPAFCVWAANIPGLRVETMHLTYDRQKDGGAFVGWPDSAEGEWPQGAFLLCLGEPMSCPADILLARLNEDRPGVPVVGGMASAPLGSNRLLVGAKIVESGAAVALVSGPVRATTLVSQGCRPIGEPVVITKAEGNEIIQLRGRPAIEYLHEIFTSLPTRDQRLFREGLQFGRVISEFQDHRSFGDFLIRGVIGGDPQRQSITVGDLVRTGQTIQFHIRDHASADVDLQQWLQKAKEQSSGVPYRAALLFSCNGRGTNLFPEADHDVTCVQREVGPIPLAGIFAAGELGPVGGQNFVHGYTASLILFSADDRS